MKKRSIGIFAAVVFSVFALTACGDKGQKGDDNSIAAEVEDSSDGAVYGSSDRVVDDSVDGASTGSDKEAAVDSGNQDTNDSSTEATNEGEESMGESAKLLYQGHASMRITTPEGKVIYVDPFAGEGYDVPADLILLTHGHYDHTQTDLITSQNDDCKTISWKEALEGGEHRSFDLGYVKVEAVEAGYNKNHDVKECVGYILTFSTGVSLYISGDNSTTPQMKELADRKLDYAFFCCDGVYNMDVSEAIECARTVGAKHNIPYHMIAADKTNNFDQKVAESFDVPGRIIVKPGGELVLE